jgi:hypothetical protein
MQTEYGRNRGSSLSLEGHPLGRKRRWCGARRNHVTHGRAAGLRLSRKTGVAFRGTMEL